jgi:hypothetical protein
VLVWLTYTERNIGVGIDLTDLWTNDAGKLDRLFVIVLGTWWLHFCAVTLWTLSRTVVTADFVTFMGWGIPIIARMFAPAKKEGDDK